MITFSEVKSLFGKSNANLVRDYLIDHYLQNYSKEEIFEMVLELRQSIAESEAEPTIDEVNSEILALDTEESFELSFETQLALPVSSYNSGEWIEIESSAVNAVRLFDDASALDVEYKSSADGLFYRYLNVPQDIFEELISIKDSGGSIGSFLASKVKYEFEYDVLSKQPALA